MPIKFGDSHVPTCFATCSIGFNESHTLPLKLEAIAAAGFDAIELSMLDVLAYSKLIHGGVAPDPNDFDTLVEVSYEIAELTREQNLKVLLLQPFSNFEGWHKGSREREDAFARARGWMRIMEAVGTDTLVIGSSDAPDIVSSFHELAADLAELADMFAQKRFRIAYENWCWATHAPRWKDVWEIVRRANRHNVGLCLDTFQSAASEWGDPNSKTGVIASMPRGQVEARWNESLAELAVSLPSEKIFLLQISDGYKLELPIGYEGEPRWTPRSEWSRDHRPLPYDGGYLPVQEFLDAVLETGYRGWLSMEVFDGRGPEKYDDMKEYAKKAMDSLEKLLQL